MDRKNLEDYLLEENYMTETDLKRVKEIQIASDKKLYEIIIDEGFISEGELTEILALSTGFPRVNLSKLYINPNVINLVPEYLARKHIVLPIKKDGNSLILAISNPYDIFAVDDIKIASGYDIQLVLATKKEIQKAIEAYYKPYADMVVNKTNNVNEELEEAEKAPVIKLVDTLVHQAVKKNASDIHIEPQEKNVRVRYRLDGELTQIMLFDKALLQAVIARIKVMANLDITKKRVPQDGSFKLTVENHIIDIRVSTIPTINGEKAVLRVLNRDRFLLSIDQLGFNKKQKSCIYKMLELPYGMILVCGPTGCGKTTTLYSMINHINKSNKNIVTLEDPVEYALCGINQMQINPKSGITFANGLRAILRQDPNIIMVGEIRDRETADIAIRAALTGHLVFSTLHTNSASGAIARLLDMGVEPYLLASCLAGIISQRLVRKTCIMCKEEYLASENEKAYMNVRDENKGLRLFKGKGCNSCNFTGYSGRTVVGEVINVHSAHRKLISRQANLQEIDKVSRTFGYEHIKDNALKLVQSGITTFEEALQVIFQESLE
ncbi:Type II secretion system protein E [Tepidanaerobacter acetatoxydans Re1]|uniref:Type II secretion system protein E n=1 Tax=Tepidanaerobacter acetatoxydans (strain DSM 21804 / JCM 16047 / Re1) TaxID=1209989 RepID=F4LVH9_TEPAE|nr:GspE/PulE family protein [Tepidanaerobacter acetatoxydans]AEE91565.1 type II secretion system protein E [Tepidanaerobacter acetatoxydans Re1]CCP26285.1 Type II secretion system protein E [Tepidanaerobacter acetatoxydans Re1]